MSQTSIEWATHVWNPLAGCTRVSEGCDHCYAAAMSLRLEAMALKDIEFGIDPGGKAKYIGIATRNGKGTPVFNGKINFDKAALDEPFRWKRPRKVFVNSMSDLFHKDVPDGFIDAVFDVMSRTPQHTYQVLTKRPERMAAYVGSSWSMSLYPNIWLGTSVENQEQADARIPHLMKLKSSVRFLSMEPLLGPVDIGPYVNKFRWLVNEDNGQIMRPLDWVIVGGESGREARPMHPDWVRAIRDQCAAAGVPFFFKQFGAWGLSPLPSFVPISGEHQLGKLFASEKSYYAIPSVTSEEFPNTIRVERLEKVGKHAAGRLLDGRLHDEFPQ